MNRGKLKAKNVIHFSHWCGKGYAVFAAIGRQIRISSLGLNICRKALLKSARKGIIVTFAACRKEDAGVNVKLKLYDKLRNNLMVRREVCPDVKCG